MTTVIQHPLLMMRGDEGVKSVTKNQINIRCIVCAFSYFFTLLTSTDTRAIDNTDVLITVDRILQSCHCSISVSQARKWCETIFSAIAITSSYWSRMLFDSYSSETATGAAIGKRKIETQWSQEWQFHSWIISEACRTRVICLNYWNIYIGYSKSWRNIRVKGAFSLASVVKEYWSEWRGTVVLIFGKVKKRQSIRYVKCRN